MPTDPLLHPLSPAELANAVSDFGVILSGAAFLILSTFVAPAHSARWRWAYFAVLLTGIPTVWYHGFGEQSVGET